MTHNTVALPTGKTPIWARILQAIAILRGSLAVRQYDPPIVIGRDELIHMTSAEIIARLGV